LLFVWVAVMTILLQMLDDGLKELKLQLSELAQQQLLAYLKLLQQWNRVYNLTAIRDLEQMVSQHLLDSLSVAPYLSGDNILDVGSGAGLPGIPLAIYFPHKQFTLLDSNGKKTRFLKQVIAELKLKNVSVIQARVEKFKPDPLFDTVISRAFSALGQFISQTEQCLKTGGVWLAMKGRLDEEELEALNRSYETIKLNVPGLNAQRHLVIFSILQ